MAQPSKRTDAARAVILEIIRGGSTRKAAYTAAGLSHQTFADWMREDEDFAQEVEEAKQDWITEAVRKIQAHATKDWRALAWLLERYDREHFAAKVQVNRLSDEDLLAIAGAIARRTGGSGGDESEGAEAPVGAD